jgi:hypothetical protein
VDKAAVSYLLAEVFGTLFFSFTEYNSCIYGNRYCLHNPYNVDILAVKDPEQMTEHLLTNILLQLKFAARTMDLSQEDNLINSAVQADEFRTLLLKPCFSLDWELAP